MKNIFSKTTAHLRLNVSTITAQLRSIYGIRILIFAFLTLGVGQAWAYDLKKNVYFDNSTKQWSEVSLVIGNDEGSNAYHLTKLNNCNLWYRWFDWGGYTDMYFINANWNDENWWKGYDCCRPYARVSSLSASNKWGPYKTDYKNSGRIYFDGVSNSSAAGDLPLYTATLKVKKSTDGGSYTEITSGSWPATINLKGTHMASDDATGQNNFNTSSGASATYNNVPVTGEVTMTLGSISDSKYEFVGWGTGSEATTTTTQYTYNITGATTYYAFFRTKEYTIAYDGGTNAESGSHANDTKYHGTNITLPGAVFNRTGYAQTGWAKSDGGSKEYELGATYTDNSAATLYPVWTAEETHDITVSYKCGTGTIKTATTESAVGVTTARNVTAPTISGFTFSGWTVGSGVKNNSASTSTNPININSKGSGDYTLTANYTCNWELKGSMDSWGSGYSMTATSATSVYAEVTLDANTNYSFKFKNGATWYGVTGDVTNITYTNKGTARPMTNTNGGSPDQTMTSAGAGTYRFTWDITNKRVTITYPTSYTVELEVGTVKGNKNTLKIFHTDPTVPANQVTSGNYVAAGTRVYFWAANGAEEATICKPGYNWWGFFNNAAGDEPTRYTNNRVSMYDVNPITSDMHVYAVFGENNYTVKMYNNGNGDVYEGGSIVTSTTAHVETASNTLTATPQTGYYFTGWDQFSDSLTINSPSTASTTIKIKSNKLGNNARLRANYSPRWSVLGSGAFGGWEAYDANPFTEYTVVSTKDIGYNTITLEANTTYEIKAYDRETSIFYGGSTTQDINYAASGAKNEYTIANTSSPQSVFIHSAAAGSYTLNWNLTEKKLAVQYPTSLFITSGQKTEGQDDNAGGSFTAVDNDDRDVTGGKFVANGASVTFTATPNTGYTFDGWYTNEDCTTGKNTSNPLTVSSINTDKTVYAKFVPKTYTVTLTRTGDGYGSGGDASATATFNATLPSATMPTAAQGYGFMGFYSATGGNGRRFIDSSGNWITSAGDTINDSKWILDNGITLYAYYKKAEITNLTFDAAVVAPSASVGVTPTVAPTPEGTNSICWKLLHNNGNLYDPQPIFSPANPGGVGNKVTFTAPPSSGMYLVAAVLRTGSSCDGGTKLDSVTYPFQVAGDHTVTVQYKCGDVTLQASKAITGKPLVWSDEITPDEIFGYSFEKWVAGDGVTMTINGGETTIETGGETTGKATTHAVQIKAIYDGKLIAKYTKKNIIYFKNTLGWSNVYVNIMSNSYWDAYNGSGNENNCLSRNQQMTLLEGTGDIYYLEYSGSTSAYMSFTSMTQPNYKNFWAGDGDHLQVVYPTRPNDDGSEQTNYGYNAGTPMFVPTAEQTPVDKHITNGGRASYYNKGYWRKYDPIQGETGYTLKVYNKTEDNGRTELKSIKFVESDVPGQLFKAVADLEAAGGYGIKFERNNSMLYTNISGHLHHTGDVVITEKGDDNYAAIWIKATAAGDYTFAITINGDGKLCIQAEFPVAKNDYRVIYTDDDTWTKTHTAESWIHPSRIISAEENAVDTISFFVSKGHSPEFKIQRVNSINEGTGAITWTDVTSWTSCDDVDASGVYKFIFTQDGSKNISFTKKEPYTGNFYIRTDAAGSTKWDNYRAADHLMTYSEYSETYSDFTHYFVAHVESTNNVKFVVANDYSPCISDTLEISTYRGGDGDHIETGGNIKANANVRFMWDRRKNAVYRAYLDEAKSDGSRFLVLRANSSEDLMDENGNPLTSGNNHGAPDNSIQFVDNENWIYETNVMVKPGAYVKLYGHFHGKDFYFKGESGDDFDGADGDSDGIANAIQLMTGTGEAQKVRVIYDFKTDRLVAAYLPSGEISTEMDINADVMFIREHQGDIDQLTFSGVGSAIKDIKTAYAVMRFNKWTLNNKEKTGSHNPLASPASPYERAMYFISFPFEVKLSEVFGIGNYGQDWIVEYYDGAERARTGWWEGEPGFWRYVWNRKDFVLQPNVGYLLQLELAAFGEESSAWNNNNERLELFFPSSGNLGTITNTTVNCTIPEHACTINRHETEGLPDTPDNPHTSYNRTIFDSHWNVMSVPTYVKATPNEWSNNTWTTAIGPKFLYTWNPDDNTLTATSGKDFEYHAMHAYMVQYGGNVQWVTSGTDPASIVARDTYAEQPKEVEFRIEIQQNEKMVDQTFVIMSNDDEINANFQFGEDMSKDFNARNANIYTMTADNVASAGNTLPMSETTTIVPVGVSVKKNGDYTFAIPEGTEGIGVTLVDNETGTRTSLSALDYTVTLQPGDYTGRFVLEISPIQNTPTGLEEPTSDSSLKGRAQKVMIDGILYIVKDGKIFDARGTRVE